MGFDVNGLNPRINKMLENFPIYHKYEQMDWKNKYEKMEENGEKETYINEYEAYNKSNPGVYFRNNVWYWRPLWGYVCSSCNDILSEKNMEDGNYNSGAKISKTKAIRIAKRLKSHINKGYVDKLEEADTQTRKELPKEECYCCNGVGTRKGWEGWQSEKRWLKYHDSLEASKHKDSTEALPATPENVGYKHANSCKGCNCCKGTGKVESFTAHYPFDADNIRDFAKFCEESGGFEIW